MVADGRNAAGMGLAFECTCPYAALLASQGLLQLALLVAVIVEL